MLELIFVQGGRQGETIRLTFEKAWFGRQPTCDFVLDSEGISRAHFSIVRQAGDYVLIDNKSTNGTFVNGLRTTVVTLRAGYTISVGSLVLQVREVSQPAQDGFRFIAFYQGSPLILDQSTIRLGRKSICHVQLNDPAVVPIHAELEHQPGGVWITDQSGGVGVYVNGQRVVKQKLHDGDTVAIWPFEIRVGLTEEKCILQITDRSQEEQSAPKTVPGSYREVVAVPAGPAAGEAKPSAAIAGLPAWMQAKAPIWVPTSDILPDRLRSILILVCLSAGLAWGAYAWAVRSHAPFSPGPTAKFHSVANAKFALLLEGDGKTSECSGCHLGFARASNLNCQGCHEEVYKSPEGKEADKHFLVHQKQGIACAICHQEHKGAQFDVARTVGETCQSAGCHVSVHQEQMLALTAQAHPTPAPKASAVAFEANWDLGSDDLHPKHEDARVKCEQCHLDAQAADEDPLKVAKMRRFKGVGIGNVDAQASGEDPDKPALKVSREDRKVSREDRKVSWVDLKIPRKEMRAKCLSCHGFGPQASLRERCYSCHFEHPTETPEKFSRTQFASTPTLPSPTDPVDGRRNGAALFLIALAAVPLFYFTASAASFRIEHHLFQKRTAAGVRDAPPPTVEEPTPPPPPAPLAPEPGLIDNQAPGGHVRPQIDLDLCVGCGTCVTVCPFNVLEIVNEKAIAARLADCTGYAACAAECPTEAITLVTGGAMQTQELPVYDANLETNVPGLYLAGEVTGKALIKIAINQGKRVIDTILRQGPQSGEQFDIIVVGAGPAGTSTALAARKEGLKVVVLEQGTVANTIRNYPRQKFVMAEPAVIPAYGPLWMEDTDKETLLEKWREIIESTGLVIQEGEKVLSVTRQAGSFLVRSSKAEYRGARVVVAIGRRGSPRKLGVPGEDAAKVAYNLLDADKYHGQAICVAGGGDSGIEAANGLARADLQNKVWLVHNGADFRRAKPRNQQKITKAIDEGRLKVFFSAAVQEIAARSVRVQTGTIIEEIENDFVFVMVGGESPKKFLSECGIEFSHRAL